MPFDASTYAKAEPATGQPTMCRVGHVFGEAPWHPISNMPVTQAWVTWGNANYGPVTHWVETLKERSR